MLLLDRWIARRFFGNFALIFSVMFLFAVSIDTILQLDAYIEVARSMVKAGRFPGLWLALPAAIVDFNAPRVFQFFAYMVGLCSVAAAGFTLTQMVRTRELVAMLAAGLSLWRIGLAIIGVAVALNLLQLVNGEVLLPRLAPLLVREHSSILQGTVKEFSVKLVEDREGRLLLASAFDAATNTATNLVILERDERGAATRRIEADSATWDDERNGWVLTGGMASRRTVRESTGGRDAPKGREVVIGETEAIDFVESDVAPRAILARRFRGFAQLLSARQIGELASEGGIEFGDATRLIGQRFAGVCVNLLMLVICLPFFLVREPQKMLRASVLCAAVAVPGLLGSLFAMSMKLPSVPATVGVFLPVALLLPVAAWRVGSLRS
jgi:lipopolysaccharide export LptBFGC system permease protein LptF